jgi:hypothetical protein
VEGTGLACGADAGGVGGAGNKSGGGGLPPTGYATHGRRRGAEDEKLRGG